MSKRFSQFFTYKIPATTIGIELVQEEQFNVWNKKQSSATQKWVAANNFSAKTGSFCLLPNKDGDLERVLVGIKNYDDFAAIGQIAEKLPVGKYVIANKMTDLQLGYMAFAWILSHYVFDKYKKASQVAACLVLPKEKIIEQYVQFIDAYALIMDMINTPAEDMYPEMLAKEAEIVAKEFKASYSQVIGEDLLKKNFPAIHAVGRSSFRTPRLIEINWGKKNNPKVVLVGKGVCFDSGGFNLKPSQYIRTMKGDMGGAAHALGLAKLIMQFNLPVNLQVLLPAVENLIDSKSYKPDDVITTRKGLTVEIENTDAEGRMILSDALAFACEGKPDLLIDFATLTGAANVALGKEIPAFFTDDEKLAAELEKHSSHEQEPIWRLPIYQPYRQYLDSKIADICNSATTRYGGAIFAALFLKEFVRPGISWVHFDIPAASCLPNSGKPHGAGVDALRTVFSYLQNKYGN